MDLGLGLTFAAALALCLVVWAYGLMRESRHPTGHDIRWFRMIAGMSLMLLAVAAGSYVIHEQPSTRIEARGYGVVVDGVRPLQARNFDVGLALTQSVTINDCDSDERATITLQVAPTAEFWIDNLTKLTNPTRVRVLIPSSGARVTSVSQGEYGVDPFTKPVVRSPTDNDTSGLSSSSSASDGDVVVELSVDDWATEREPVQVTYTAPLVRPRGLGTCYVNLPALTGLPTVISGASLEGLDRPSVDELESGTSQGLFIVSSTLNESKAVRFAYYDPRFEITRGVTVLELEGGLSDEESQPSPNANFAGSPAWTCASTVASDLRFLEDEAAKRRGGAASGAPATNDGATEDAETADEDPFFSTSRTDGGTYALSGDRIDEVLEQKDCAARVELREASAGINRDVLFLFIGAIFSAGTGFLTTSVRRRRSATTGQRNPRSTTSSGSDGATRRMLAAISRMKTSREKNAGGNPDG